MKKIILSTLSILLIVIITVGGTYAYFQASTSSNEANVSSQSFEVIYTGGTEINSPMQVVATKEQGLKTAIQIKITPNSVVPTMDLILNISSMTDSLSQDGFKWEVIGKKNNIQVYHNNGNFINYHDGDTITIVNDYIVSTDDTNFDVYLWIDGELVGNEVLGASFSGYISAQTENFTGTLSK